MESKKEIPADSVKKQHLKAKALSISIEEGSASSFSDGVSSSYITPLALAINSNELQIGLLSSLSGLVSPLAQLYGNKLMKNHTRKKIVLTFVFFQAVMWLSIASLAFAFSKNIFREYLPYILIILYAFIVILGGFATPSWFSWMGDLVPEKERGKYFGKRNKATGTVGLAATLIAAFILDAFKTRGFILLGFTVLFTLAFAFRFISFLLFKKQFAPKFKVKRGSYFSLFSFIKRYDNFGKFSVYMFFFYFALMIASPFFSVYMLKELNFGYIPFIIVTISSSVFYLLFTPFVGKFSDKFGNARLFKIASFCFAINPILWIFIKSPLLLIFIPQVVSGLANATFTIAFTNFTYDSVSPQKRGICLAYTNLLIGLGTFFGSLFGGFVLHTLHPASLSPFIFLFTISGVLRLVSGVLFLPKIKDERKVERIPPMRIQLAHPFKALQAEIGWVKAIFK